ncbi:MAG: hypothetical protein IKG21_03615 [Atopobiaceae bacterium]|nr:hypothetical protein [Atopobiaceae bacterium]
MDAQTERERITKELSTLPAGTIVTKHIAGREQPYLQWREGGKVRSRYLKATERESVAQQVARRKELAMRLKELDAMQNNTNGHSPDLPQFETTVRVGQALVDRAVIIHTTHVPFREHARLLGTKDIDEYIEYGGTLRMGANNLDEPYSYDGDADPTFATEES